MKILGITDLHGDVSHVDRLYAACGPVDVTLISGDLTHFGHADEARSLIEAITRHCPQVLAVAGNCDHPDVEEYLAAAGYSLHHRAQIRADCCFIGMGKALPGPVSTPNEADEAEFSAGLEQALAESQAGLPLIVVVHQPPFNTRNDRILFGKHVGSRAIRRFIEIHQPAITFCGHIHEGSGIDTIAETFIVNPGPLAKGHYSYAQLDESGWHVRIASLHDSIP